MSNLESLLKKLKVDNSNIGSYVYYTKSTGKIHKISSSNKPDGDYKTILIAAEEVKPLLTGQRRTEEFIISYDFILKKIILKEISSDRSYKTVDLMCYQLPVLNDKQVPDKNKYDIIIEQNICRKHWSISISPNTKSFLEDTGVNLQQKLYFSITSKYDPNILYRSLEFSILSLLQPTQVALPFVHESEGSIEGVSIYTAKYFNSYIHNVV